MSEKRLRLQVRVVQTVFRAELRRLDGAPGTVEREARMGELWSRSMAILEGARAELDGSAGWHPELSELVLEVETELRAEKMTDGSIPPART